MISVEKLNEHLFGNFDAIISILENLGLTNIHSNYTKKEIRCSREEGRNPSSIRINTDTLYYRCFSTGDKGNIYTLIMDRLDKTFPQSLEWASSCLGLETAQLKHKAIKLPFGGYFKRILKQIEEPELNMKTYSEDILQEFSKKYNLLFNEDGIDYKTQEFFKVGYDELTNRITIPQWDLNGNLVGIMGRLNDRESNDYRWLPIIPCQRSYTLFGYHFNYRSIQEKGFCLIGESEKFVMQLRAMGLYNALATCGCDISYIQAKYLKSLMCKRLIICFDEGLSEDQIIKQARKLKINNPIYENHIGYVYDAKGEILKYGSKNSPSDLGAKNFKTLVETKTVWLD